MKYAARRSREPKKSLDMKNDAEIHRNYAKALNWVNQQQQQQQKEIPNFDFHILCLFVAVHSQFRRLPDDVKLQQKRHSRTGELWRRKEKKTTKNSDFFPRCVFVLRWFLFFFVVFSMSSFYLIFFYFHFFMVQLLIFFLVIVAVAVVTYFSIRKSRTHTHNHLTKAFTKYVSSVSLNRLYNDTSIEWFFLCLCFNAHTHTHECLLLLLLLSLLLLRFLFVHLKIQYLIQFGQNMDSILCFLLKIYRDKFALFSLVLKFIASCCHASALHWVSFSLFAYTYVCEIRTKFKYKKTNTHTQPLLIVKVVVKCI